MKRKSSFGLLLTILMVIGLLWGRIVIVSARTPTKAENSALSLSLKIIDFHLAVTDAYTTYLPIIILSPAGSPKKGVGGAESPVCNDLKTLQASWYINWKLNPDPTCAPSDLKKFVPRIYNASSMPFLSLAIENAKASGWLIGFTEPNLPWQGNVSPTEGAILWKQIEDAAIPAGIKLVSPSPNQWNPGEYGQPYGHQWTWVMVDEYRKLYGKNPHFDAIAWNIYKQRPQDTQAYLISRRNEALARGYNVPIWVLEYAGECWKSGSGNTGNNAIMAEITTWFEATPWIGRYAWFANRITNSIEDGSWYSCSLIDPNNNLTYLGQLYSGY